MGGEQKPAHHRLGRGGKKPIVIIGTVVVFFVLLSMTGLGHSHNHVERDMPAHAALSGRRAGRHRSGDADYARTRLHGAHGIRDRHHGALDGATHRVGLGGRAEPDRAHDVHFGHAIDNAIETKAKAWMHEVMDPVVDTLHDSAEGGIRGGAGAHHHHHGLGASEGGASLASSVERAADAAGGLQHSLAGLAHLAHATHDAVLDADAAGAANAFSDVGGSRTRFGDDPDDVAENFAALSSGLNPMRGARDGATDPSRLDPRLVWHPPPKVKETPGADAGTHAHGALSTGTDELANENALVTNSFSSSADKSSVSVGALGALDDLDDLDDDEVLNPDAVESVESESRTVDRSNAASSGVPLSCERCSHHGTCALGGECQCAAMFEGKACRIMRALAAPETSDPADLKRSGLLSDPVLAGFARGFGGSMTLTNENAPAKLEARPIASGAVAHNASVAAEEHLEVEDDWTRRDDDDDAATLSLARVDDGHPDFHSRSHSSDSDAFAQKASKSVRVVGDASSKTSSSFASGEKRHSTVADSVFDPAPAPPAKFGKITRTTRERLPERGPFDEAVFHRCALVGSGGFHASARPDQELGFEVDAHDVVFRFGDDPVIGYENVVGSRTTFRLVVDDANTNPQSQYLGEALPRTEKGVTSVPVTRPDGVFSSLLSGSEDEDGSDGADGSLSSRKEDGPPKTVRFVRDSVSFKRYLAARLAKPELEAHVAHPDFIAWVDGAVASTPGPSPELYGALLAAHKCREVNLYGFQTQSFFGAKDAYHERGDVDALADISRDSGSRDDRGSLLFGDEDERKTSSEALLEVRAAGRATDAAETLSTASTASTLENALNPREWSVLTRMAKAGVVHFAEPCVVECHENAAACDKCVADPDSFRAARAAVGRSRVADDAATAADDSEKSVGASLDHWMSGVAGTFAHSGFEKAEPTDKDEGKDKDADGSETASVASAVFARSDSRFGAADDVDSTDRFEGGAIGDDDAFAG